MLADVRVLGGQLVDRLLPRARPLGQALDRDGQVEQVFDPSQQRQGRLRARRRGDAVRDRGSERHGGQAGRDAGALEDPDGARRTLAPRPLQAERYHPLRVLRGAADRYRPHVCTVSQEGAQGDDELRVEVARHGEQLWQNPRQPMFGSTLSPRPRWSSASTGSPASPGTTRSQKRQVEAGPCSKNGRTAAANGWRAARTPRPGRSRSRPPLTSGNATSGSARVMGGSVARCSPSTQLPAWDISPAYSGPFQSVGLIGWPYALRADVLGWLPIDPGPEIPLASMRLLHATTGTAATDGSVTR